MTIRLPFIDRIKLLSRDFINGKSLALNRPPSYEVEILPSSSQQASSSKVRAIKLGEGAATTLASARSDRLWLATRGSGRDVEHTHSNLG